MFTLTAATTTETNSNSQQLLALLFPTLAEKAWRGGGGMGASSGLGGLLLQQAVKARRTGPGSRGGHFWMNASGHVEYGPKPSGIRAVATGRGGGSGKPRVGELRPGYRIKPQTATGKVQQQRRMLSEMDRVISTGKDPHGNRLSAENLSKLRFLATSLRSDLKTGRKKELAIKKEIAIATKEGHTGVMVAFYLDTFSPDAAVRLQVPGGETWDALHLTLAFLGDSTLMLPDTESKLYQLISQFAANQCPVEGTVSGIGLFNAAEEGETNAFYASFDSPNLPSFRQQLMELLQSNWIGQEQNHGFTPHITLAYIPKDQPLPTPTLPSMPIIFSKVTVKWGDKRTDFSIGTVTKEVKSEIATQAANRLPFTVFKDAKGQYRWVGVSSSAAEDGDGETVSQKALQDDVARKDITGSYGPLNWWHTHVRLGTCDFNAMDGPLLVESGTFVSSRVAVAVARAISEGKLEPGMSLEFEHNEPGPQVLPGRVFKRINKVGRALLPAEKASNLLTSFKVYNSLKSTSTSPAAPAGDATTTTIKESSKMLTEEKYKKLESIIPADLLEGLLSGNEVAVKSAELAGYSFKAMTPPMAKDVTNAVQTPAPDKTKQPPVTAKADVADPALAAVTDGADTETPLEDLAEGGTEGGEGEGAYEDSPADMQADAIMQGLYDKIDEIVQTRLEAASKDILAALGGVNAKATASKEVSDTLAGITMALKENATAFEKVLGENVALKARLDALEGVQPTGVQARTRASQMGGLGAEQLSESDKELVASEKANQDPYLKIIQQLGLVPGPRG